MLFAYAISGDTLLTTELLNELRQVTDDLARENLPAGLTLSFNWDALVPGQQVNGTFLRGYQHVADCKEALWLTHVLQRLSSRFPQFSLYLSGCGELPMTQLEGGQFGLFSETYEIALAVLAHEQATSLNRRVRF